MKRVHRCPSCRPHWEPSPTPTRVRARRSCCCTPPFTTTPISTPCAPRWPPGRRVLTLDWPGHGASPLPPAPLRAVQFGDLLVEFADQLDLRNLVVVGNSVGGYAACRLALERPDRVSGVVLVNTGGFTPHSVFTRFLCAVMGRPAVVGAVFPAFVRGYMRRQERHRQDRRHSCRGPRENLRRCENRCRTVEELHRTRPRPAGACLRHRSPCADHLGCQGSHRPAALGQGGRSRDPGIDIRGVADRTRRLLVRACGMAAIGAAVHRCRTRCSARGHSSVGEPAAGRAEAQPGVPIARPAPPDLRRVCGCAAVSAGAVADPHRGRPGVQSTRRLTATLDPIVMKQRPRSSTSGRCNSQCSPSVERQRRASGFDDRRQRFVGAPVGHRVTPVEVVQQIQRRIGNVDRRDRRERRRRRTCR